MKNWYWEVLVVSTVRVKAKQIINNSFLRFFIITRLLFFFSYTNLF